ncbi:unnamed protein product [Ambrosiozyma monospora]|uniref:Unnamed protein product n=1 Tax=Ambrosiozyma monospora TaxID=43982 RepID=A0A9W6YWG2_AMBMO|nr:unnamed protein product [Ambrosiozyma monospora]
MKENGIIYGDSISYRHMCRYESGFFFRHPLLDDYEWYWRVDPGINILCDINYDLFKYMKDNNKVYGFTITLPEYIATIPTLWDVTKEFIKENPQYVAEDNLMDWVSDDGGATYKRMVAIIGPTLKLPLWTSGDQMLTLIISITWIKMVVFSMKDGVMLLSIQLLPLCSYQRIRSTSLVMLVTTIFHSPTVLSMKPSELVEDVPVIQRMISLSRITHVPTNSSSLPT